jgi:hypothetical protein
MADWVRRALTKRVHRGSRGKEQVMIVEPDEKLVYTIKFALGMTVCLAAIEVAHIAFLGRWNSEVFAAITGLIGTVSGIFIGQQS